MTRLGQGQRLLVTLFFLAAVVQFLLAGVGTFGAGDFEAHRVVGFALAPVALLIAVLALVTRRLALPGVLLLVLVLTQVALIEVGKQTSPWVAAFHPLNGLLVTGLAGFQFGQLNAGLFNRSRAATADPAWRRRR